MQNWTILQNIICFVIFQSECMVIQPYLVKTIKRDNKNEQGKVDSVMFRNLPPINVLEPETESTV